MNSWHSYPSIYAMGHRALANLLDRPVLIEEKVDGSQFSFGITEDGEIMARSKGAILNVDAPEKMFGLAIESVKSRHLSLHPGWTYRAEYLQKQKHNSLAYERTPRGHLIVFDVNPDHEAYLSYAEKHAEAERIGLECVPLVYEGVVASVDQFKAFLDRTSVLGGQKIEGVVIKPSGYVLYGQDKKMLLGKFVSEAFKEVHAKERERGLIADSPKDIGMLLKEVQSDIGKECKEEIADQLFKWAWPHIQRKAITGLPEWYKDELLKKQFEPAEVAE